MNRKLRHAVSGLVLGIGACVVPIRAFAGGSNTTMSEALFNTVLGIGTVFIMLIVMSLIIYCFRIIPMIQNKFSRKSTDAQQALEAKAPAAVPSAAPAVPAEDDLELIAVIAAAIAASEQIPLDSFRVRTIKRRA